MCIRDSIGAALVWAGQEMEADLHIAECTARQNTLADLRGMGIAHNFNHRFVAPKSGEREGGGNVYILREGRNGVIHIAAVHDGRFGQRFEMNAVFHDVRRITQPGDTLGACLLYTSSPFPLCINLVK